MKEYFISFLFTLYFILHQANYYFGLLAFAVIVKYFLIYLLIAIILFGINLAILKMPKKASLYTIFLQAIFFFFGAYHDSVKSITALAWMKSYTANLIIITVLIISGLIIVKMTGVKRLLQIHRYGFSMLVILVLWEVVALAYNASSNSQKKNDLGDSSKALSSKYNACDTCYKPDIYFIVFDGFTSSICLQEEFSYNNKDLDSFLVSKGFYIVDSSKSNYAITPLSIASTLNLNYLDSSKMRDKLDITLLMQGCESMYLNELNEILKKEGYTINNLGVFDLKDYPRKETYFGHIQDAMIHQQTLVGRIKRDILWNLQLKNMFTGKRRVPPFMIRQREYHVSNFITNNINGLYKVLAKKSSSPEFVYCHLMIPHEPFFFNKDGQFNPLRDTSRLPFAANLKYLYLNQLVYAGKLMRKMVDSIMSATNGNSIIIIQGDHGFRDFESVHSKNKIFPNLNCFYFPDKNYSTLYKTLSPVNTFRVVINKFFGKNYPLLKDTSIYIDHQGFLFEKNSAKNRR